MSAKPRDPSPPAEAAPGSTARSIVSLVLFVHLFCLFVALSSNYLRSPLQIDLLNTLAPYIHLFKLHPTAPYHLTDGSEISHDHYLEVEVTGGPNAGEIVRLPAKRLPGFPPVQRAQMLARTMGVTSYLGNDQVTATLARAVGARVLDQGENEEVIVRVRRLQSQQREIDPTNPNTPDDPTADVYHTTAYQARVWRDQYDQVQLLKIEEREVVAPLEGNGQ